MKPIARSRVLVAAVSISAYALVPTSAFADGPYANELSKCLVRSTTDGDKALLVQWMFATVALHPEVKWMATVTDNQRAEINKKTAGLFEKLLTQACLAETRQALKYEGESTLSTSFSVLGQVAARELFASPSVASGMADLGKLFDSEKMRKTLGLSK